MWLTGHSVVIPVLYNFYVVLEGYVSSLNNEYFKKSVAGLTGGIKFIFYILIFKQIYNLHLFV